MVKYIKKSVREFRIEFLKTAAKMVSAAFALVAALAWNTAISEIIKKYLKPDSNVFSWLIYALVVTFFAVMVGFYLSRVSSKIKKEEELEKELEKRRQRQKRLEAEKAKNRKGQSGRR